MNPFRRTVALSAAAVLLLTACAASSVGTVAISWLQENQDPVGQEVLMNGATLIPDKVAWDQWVADLPADMRQARIDELDAFTLDDSIAVVAVWGRCTEYSQVDHVGDGVLEFHVVDEEPNTNCGWSPRRVEVWDIPLEALGVEREEVTLTD